MDGKAFLKDGVPEMEATKAKSSIKTGIKKIGLSAKGLFSNMTTALLGGFGNVRFRLTYMVNAFTMSRMTTGGRLSENKVIAEILATNGVFSRYKHFKQIKTLVEYLETLSARELTSKLGPKYIDTIKECIDTFDILTNHRVTMQSNVLYFQELKGKATDNEVIAYSPYVMAVISLVNACSYCAKAGAVLSNLEAGDSRTKFINVFKTNALLPFIEPLRTHNRMVRHGMYPQYITSCIDGFRKTGRISTGIGESGVDTESVGAIIVAPIIIFFLATLLTVMCQFSVFFVFHIRGRIAIMLSELIKDIEDMEGGNAKHKAKTVNDIRKAMIKIDIEEHNEAAIYSQTKVDNNIKKAIKESKSVSTEDSHYSTREEEDGDLSGMDIL